MVTGYEAGFYRSVDEGVRTLRDILEVLCQLNTTLEGTTKMLEAISEGLPTTEERGEAQDTVESQLSNVAEILRRAKEEGWGWGKPPS